MSKDYAIMRIEKLTTNNDFARALNHNLRAYENSTGVHKELSQFNIVDGPVRSYKDVKEVLKLRNKMIEEQTGYKVKKNRVRGFEVLFAVNQEFMKDQIKRDEYFRQGVEWCKETFGEQNYLNSTIHLDEDGAAHMHVIVTSLAKDKDGINKYLAENYVKGRKSLIDMQDSWHSKVAYLGLERGKSAKFTHNYHKTKEEYAKLLQKDLKCIETLSEHERNLLAIEGLRAQREKEKIMENMQNAEMLKNIDFNELEESLVNNSLEEDFEL